NYDLAEGNKEITLQDFTVDGNAINQSADCHGGVCFLRATSCKVTNVKAKNVRGTTGGSVGPNGNEGEGFQFEAGLSSDMFFNNCVAESDMGSTASGFSTNGGTNIFYTSCISSGMLHGNGFTHNGCAEVHYVNCRGYKNHGTDFNCEAGKSISYVSCHSGGIARSPGTSYPLQVDENLGGSVYGFVAAFGSSHVKYVGCRAHKQQVGLYVGDDCRY